MWSVGLSSSCRVSHDEESNSLVTYLQQAVYDLPPYIGLVSGEELPLYEAVDAFCEAVLGLQVLRWWMSVGRTHRRI